MISLSPQFINALHATITDRLNQKREQLADGLAQDFADYRHRCGYISALSDCLQYFDDINKKLSEGKDL